MPAPAAAKSTAKTTTRRKTVSRPRNPQAALYDQLGLQDIRDFDGARDSGHPATRLAQVRQRSLRFRDSFQAGPEVAYYRSFNLVRAPYPVKYGLLNAAKVATPLMHIINRVFILQYHGPAGIKTLLFSPSDYEANAETPYFKRLSSGAGPIAPLAQKLLAPSFYTVETALAKSGIRPEEVDFISFDHLHTQDVRRWLGSNGKPAVFPNAKLLIMRQEWESTQQLIGPQLDWYCPGGISGIDADKVVLLDSSVKLGDGVALLQTPGHTEGNHSLVANTPLGLLVTSENGISADNYAPLESNIPGVADYARKANMEIILNGNTLERTIDQYISMVMEKTIAGPNRDNPQFSNVVPSSELTSYWAFPGIKPSFSFGELSFGTRLKV